MSNWTDELKAQAVKMYLEREPNADNSMEIVKEIADEMDQSPNGVRMILTKATNADGSPVYIKKTPATKASSSSSSSASGDKTPRVSKEAAHARLNEAITAAGQQADAEIVSKLTGKAALHFAEIIEAISKED